MHVTESLPATAEPSPKLVTFDAVHGYAVALCATTFALAARLALNPLIGASFPFASFFLAIVVTAWFAGLAQATVATVLAMLLTAVFWFEPIGWPHVYRTDEAMGLLFTGGVGFALALLVDGARRSRDRMRESHWQTQLYASRITRLQQLTAEVSAAVDVTSVAEIVARHGAAMLDARAALVVAVDDHGRKLEVVHADGVDTWTVEQWRASEFGAPAALLNAVRGGRAYVFADLHADEPAPTELGSVLAAPMQREGRVVGVIAFEFAERRVGLDELGLAKSIAAECALAMDRVRLFEAERHARTHAERAVSAHKELLAIVSHDLRSPLGVLMMGCEQVSRSCKPEQQRQTALMKRAGQRMTALITDLLDAANLEAGVFTMRCSDRVRVGTLIDDALELARPTAEQRQLMLESDVEAGGVELVCDRGRLLQVLGNLLGNAVKFTPEGGAIHVREYATPIEIVIAVTDTGPGIQPEQRERLFERYYRGARTSAVGSGLGLYIAKGIVRAHGGTLTVDSEPGLGSTFRVTLPRSPSC